MPMRWSRAIRERSSKDCRFLLARGRGGIGELGTPNQLNAGNSDWGVMATAGRVVCRWFAAAFGSLAAGALTWSWRFRD